MFRNAYRRFSDGHESLLDNYTVSASAVAGYAGLNCDGRSRETGESSSKARISRIRPGAGWAASPPITKATLASALVLPAAQLIRKFVMPAVW